MKANILSIDGKVKKEIELPKVFSTPLRPDVIRRAVLSTLSFLRQPYGPDKMAGKRTSAHYHGSRHADNTMMNREMSRMKRIHEQGYLDFRARFVPQAVKGRAAHAPKPEKIWAQKINEKERKLAVASAIAATADEKIVSAHGHRIQNIKLPIVVDDDLESLKKTKDVYDVLQKLGLNSEIERAAKKKVRAGIGKTRGRKYKKKVGPLIVVADDKGIGKAARNIPGIDVARVQNLSALHLAPGAQPGRLTIWTESAIKKLE